MSERSKILALINLLDDPDESIYGHIRDELKSFGSDIIPKLEDHWERNRNGVIFQQRIEDLIQDIQFTNLEEGLVKWWNEDSDNLLEGVIWVARHKYPELNTDELQKQLEAITKEIWLELNDYLTALEKVQVINHFLFKVHGFVGNAGDYHSTKNSYFNEVLASKKGNPLSLSILYLLIGQALQLPIYGVNLPRHFITAFIDPFQITDPIEESAVLFYINPYSKGSVFGHQELIDFLDKIKLEPREDYFVPCDNKAIVSRMLNNLIFSYSREGAQEQADRIKALKDLLI